MLPFHRREMLCARLNETSKPGPSISPIIGRILSEEDWVESDPEQEPGTTAVHRASPCFSLSIRAFLRVLFQVARACCSVPKSERSRFPSSIPKKPKPTPALSVLPKNVVSKRAVRYAASYSNPTRLRLRLSQESIYIGICMTLSSLPY